MTHLSDRVYALLKTIPSGQVWSYAELARRTGNAKAIRAVATIVGKNPHPISTPCHRIICSDGRLGQFTWKNTSPTSSSAKKLSLLKSEGVLFTKRMVSHKSRQSTDIAYRTSDHPGYTHTLKYAPKGAIL